MGCFPYLIRRFTTRDIADGMRLKDEAGWNQTTEDWQFLIQANPNGCFAAIDGDTVVGSVTTTNYGDVAWLGMVLVRADYRRQGIAGRLMDSALTALAECETVKLDATAEGRCVYTKLGFEDEYTLTRMTISAVPGKVDERLVTVGAVSDWDAIFTYDQRAFGGDRSTFLTFCGQAAPHMAGYLMSAGRLGAYVVGRPGSRYHQMGPIVADTADAAITVASGAFSALAGWPVVIDVPDSQVEFIQWLGELGFRAQRQFVRMYRGSNSSPGLPPAQFAVGGPEVG